MAMPADQRPQIDATCPGVWITPIPAGTKVADPSLSNISIQAEDVHYDPNDISTLRGNVSITQPGRRIDADNAELTSLNGKGTLYRQYPDCRTRPSSHRGSGRI
jgi:LPS-assembly protein